MFQLAKKSELSKDGQRYVQYIVKELLTFQTPIENGEQESV